MKYAKYVWTTSYIASLTIREHAIISHMIESNAFVTNCYEKLPNNHWLKRILKIFTFRTVYINQSIFKVLLVENGLVHRIWGFTYPSLTRLCKDIVNSYTFVPFTKRFDPLLNSLSDDVFPMKQDYNEYYQITHQFVSNYVDSYMTDDDTKEACDHDQCCKSFFDGLCQDLKISDKDLGYNKENLVSLVSNMICIVTGYHEQVGSVFDNVCVELDWHDTKLYQSKSNMTMQSKNDWVATAILVMLTGVRNPMILNDFSHVLLKDDKLHQNKQILQAWQNELLLLVEKIEQRNKTRRIPFECVNPKNLECSVSI